MKTIITLTLFVASLLCNAQMETTTNSKTEGHKITITVPTKSDDGKIIIGLYNEKENFMVTDPYKGTIGKIENGKAVIVFENIPEGMYAISLFHDKNDNNIMDFSANKMPLEDYGMSNNVMVMGPPTWSDAKFEVTGKDLEMEIRM
ncbi:DUF2141 domain-containing protein [Patiriisocius sp. Uisw_017]|jgi:uncharacterized protein (DUF2141 family)|uniref:DUF2141 domain-containing protein n=1 Tax=Patiriisocius sp. Uisw_017 TaxID=3230968 RepID=UPI0039EAC898